MPSTNSAKGAPPLTTSGRTLTKRDELILEHVADYRLSIRPVIEARFFDGADADNVLTALIEDDRLQVVKRGLAGGYSWYQLTRREALARQRSENLGRPLSGIGLHRALAVLWFCRGRGNERYRLEKAEAEKALDGYAPNDEDPYCIDATDGTIFRVLVPGATAGDDYILKKLRTVSQEAFSDQRLFALLKSKEFGFAILVETEQRRAKLATALTDDAHKHQAARVEVFCAPGPTTLKEFLS